LRPDRKNTEAARSTQIGLDDLNDGLSQGAILWVAGQKGRNGNGNLSISHPCNVNAHALG
jgi:hypothetical protein